MPGSSFTLAHSRGNLLRTLAVLGPVRDRSLASLKEKHIEIGAKLISHGR